MTSRQDSPFIVEMERVKNLMKLTSEERKREVRRQMFEELRALEMERREREALETREKLKRERENSEKLEESLRRLRETHLDERRMQETKQREEEERKASEPQALKKAEQDLLKQERLPWKKVAWVEEEPEDRPRYKPNALEKMQLCEQEEADLCALPAVENKASHDRQISDSKACQQQDKRKPLNNRVVGLKIESEPVKREPHPNSSTYLLFAAEAAPKSEGKTDKQRPKPEEPKQWLPDKLRVGFWMDKYQEYREKKDEKRRLKAEEQYARWTSYKASRASHISRQYDCYTGGFAANRNSILKSVF